MKNVFLAAALFSLAVPAIGNAQVLDPNAYASAGALSLASGSYTIDTDALTFAGNSGVLSNGIAVFDFSSINVAAGATVNVIGSHPLALLSLGDATFGAGSSFNLNGGNGGYGQLGKTPYPPTGANGLPGSGGYIIGPGASGWGGGFGGGGGTLFGRGDGPTYGNLLTKLEGGSGGGSGQSFYGGGGMYASGGGGGGAGGAIEINALGNVILSGKINANGGSGGLGGYGTGSGGSGGGILLAGNRLFLTTTGQINAYGGDGNPSSTYPGSGGGGGRVTIQSTYPNGFLNQGVFNVAGGGGSIFYNSNTNGGDGVITVNGRVTNTPAPGSLLVMAAGLAGGAAFLRRKRKFQSLLLFPASFDAPPESSLKRKARAGNSTLTVE